MTDHPNLKIIAIVGLAGTGKSTVVDHLTEKGYPKVYFGGIILDAMKDAGIEINPANEKKFREEIRAREGNDFVVNRIIEQINGLARAGQHRVIADGLYSWTEYKALKHAFPHEVSVLAVAAPRHLRYERLTHRAIRPLSKEEAIARDWAEIENIEKGGPIAIADYTVVNDQSPEALFTSVDDALAHLDF